MTCDQILTATVDVHGYYQEFHGTDVTDVYIHVYGKLCCMILIFIVGDNGLIILY